MDEDTDLIAYLTANDAECPSCGYQLRSLRSTTCPECGEQLTMAALKPSVPSTTRADVAFEVVAAFAYAALSSLVTGFGADWLSNAMNLRLPDIVIGLIGFITFFTVLFYRLTRSTRPTS